MSKTSFLVGLLLLTVNTACTPPNEPVQPDADTTGFAEARLDRIGDMINREITSGKIPGAVALVARNGQIAYFESFGLADIESQAEMEKDSIFRLASMTKAITTVGAMKLYERGLFQLHDPVSKYIPEYADMQVVSEVDDDGNVSATVPAEAQIKIIDLLTHTSGLSYSYKPNSVQQAYRDAGLNDGATSKDVTLAHQMKTLAEQPLMFQPGSDFLYGLNIDLLGYLIEVLSGKPLNQYFVDEIFKPLGMEDTYFYLPEAKADRLVTLYAETDDGLIVSVGGESTIKLDNPLYPIGDVRTYFSGGLGLSGTAQDYARFLQMLLNEGELDGERILSRKSVELMRTAHVDWDGDQMPDFGLGFQVTNDLGKTGELGSVGNYEWSGAFHTSYWLDPSENMIAVLMSQVRPTKSELLKKFKTMVYQALE